MKFKIEELMNEAKFSTDEILNTVYEIGRWWTENADLLGYEIGNYQLRCLTDGYWIVFDVENYCPRIPKVLGDKFGGEFRTSNYNCGSQENHLQFLKMFPVALREKLEEMIKSNRIALENLDEILSCILHKQKEKS